MFNKYDALEKRALESIVDFTNKEIQKKQDKEKKLKQLSDQADGIELGDSAEIQLTNNNKNIPMEDDLL